MPSTLLLVAASLLTAEVPSPLAPDQAIKHFQLADASLKIELAASEPNVIDPVAIRFDEDGRMWVVQMSDYPLGNPKGGEPLSKIRVLEDKDGDGLFETATTFADKLLFITGLQPWKGGVFVTRSGKLTYMKDTDGDGRADVDELWFEGFAEQNSQLRANHPRLALDNWIYVANGLRGGQVINRKLGEDKPINISGMDFRFNPLSGACEAVSGNGQFGLAFDDWGNRFICSNRNPVKHVVIEDRYLKANPDVTVPATVNDVAAFGEQSHIFPISRAWTTSNLHAGQFTAACGVYIYRGDLLPAEFKGNAFTCDPTGNLIHREIMQSAGPTFTSKPAYEGKEFLASPDEWFRPVNMELGPDGALYVVDMYRCVIEHPDFVPDELKRRPDLRLGDDRGRIWRIVPKVGRSVPERPAPRTNPALSKASSEQLVALLDHQNAWHRETAQRLLLEQDAAGAAPQIQQLLTTTLSPVGRSHAYWSLAGVHSILTNDCERALRDPDGRVRSQGVRVAESTANAAKLKNHVHRLCDGEFAPTRFQARLTASLFESVKPLPLSSVLRDMDDPWMRRSLLIYFGGDLAAKVLAECINQGKNPSQTAAGFLALVEELATLAAADAKTDLKLDLQPLFEQGRADVALAALRGASKVWTRRGKSQGLFSDLPVEPLKTLAQDKNASIQNRAAALALLSFAPRAGSLLFDFTATTQTQPLRLAAIGALARTPGSERWPALLSGFASDTPPIRRAIIDGLLSSPEKTTLLLDAIEAGQIKPSEIDLAQVKRLTAYRDAKIKARAQKLLAAATPADRAKALADYQPVLKLKGDAQHGQAVFEKNCAVCHRIAGIGTTVAPDISDSRTKQYDQLLTDILQPNRAIDNNYLGYTVRLADGSVLTGILTSETATSITLRQQGGKDAVLSRTEIDELKSTGQSLMPEGLERNIPPKEMADLLAFIKNWRYLDGRTPLSESKR